MGMFDAFSGSFGIDLGISPGEWFGEDRPDEQRQQNVHLQKEFAQNSIQWRVNDAKAAGLHPLYGVGASGTSYSPNAVTVGDGTTISARPGTPGEGMQRRANQQAQPINELEKNQDARLERQANNDHAATLSRIATDTAQQGLLAAQTDWTRQQIADSIAARSKQTGGINKERAVVSPTPTDPADAWEVKPREVMPSNSLGSPVAAGPPGAGFEPIWIAPGIPALVPAGAAQNLGDMELSGWLVSIAATAAWWGQAAADKVFDAAIKAGHAITQKDVSNFRRNNLTFDTGGGAP